MHVHQPETSCCEPRTVFTAPGCADGVSWLRIIETQGANAGVRWLNLTTNELVDTMPAGWSLGECPAEPTGALFVVEVSTAPPATGNTGDLPRLEHIATTGEAWIIGSGGEAVQVERAALTLKTVDVTAAPPATGNTGDLPRLERIVATGEVWLIGTDGKATQVERAPTTEFAKVVYVNTVDPATATIFDDVNPPVANDATLPQDDANLYVGSDGSTWVWNGAAYVTKVIPAATEWMLAGTTTDAGADKTSAIYRRGRVLLATSGFTDTSPRLDLHVQAGGSSAFAGFGNGMLFSTNNAAGARVFLEHLGAATGRRMVSIWHENGLTKFAGILNDDATAWVAENNIVVRNNGGPIIGAVGIRNATPVSHLDVGGSFGANIEKTATPTQGLVANSHTYISQVGNNFVNLPAPSSALATSNSRRIYVVKRVPTATTPTVVQGHIDDVAGASLSVQPGQARTFQSDGTTWWVI